MPQWLVILLVASFIFSLLYIFGGFILTTRYERQLEIDGREFELLSDEPWEEIHPQGFYYLKSRDLYQTPSGNVYSSWEFEAWLEDRGFTDDEISKILR